MNKTELLQLVDNLDFPKAEFYIHSESSLLLCSLIEFTDKLNIYVTETLLGNLKIKYLTDLVLLENNNYSLFENIEIMLINDTVTNLENVDGFQIEPFDKVINYYISEYNNKNKININKLKDFIKIKNPITLSKYMQDNISYFWNDNKNNKRNDFNETLYYDYSLMTPIETIVHQYGICVDQVELERMWFNLRGFNFKTICIQVIRDNDCPGHVLLIYEDGENWYWFENAWYDMRGIHKYDNFKSCIDSITNKFIIQNNITNDQLSGIEIYEYSKYPFHSNYEMMDKYSTETKCRKFLKIIKEDER
ncbi:MAG: hypothetical protein ACK5HP_04605 [Bacilli bacterium]